MKKRRTFFYTMLAAGLLASCTNDELADNPLADGSVAAPDPCQCQWRIGIIHQWRRD